MHKAIRAIFALVAILLILPNMTFAEDNSSDWRSKRYSVEFQFGGGYWMMEDVNNYLPEATFAAGSTDEINIGMQLGVGFFLRQLEDFGWAFGYNGFMTPQKHRRSTYFTSTESWAEQTVSGGELYFLPTWIFPWDNKEITFSVGPAFYTAKVNRSVSIVRTEGAGANAAGSFEDAKGTTLGAVIAAGLEFPMKDDFYLRLNLGGRFAKIAKIYEETPDGAGGIIKQEIKRGSGSSFAVDYSGVYLNLAIRAYFQPDTKWRSLQ